MGTSTDSWSTDGEAAGRGGRRRERPATTIVTFRGIRYRLDLHRCRQALVWRQVEGELASMTDLAARVGVSRSTVSRFFAGRSTSLRTTLSILEALRLDFGAVAWPHEPGEAPRCRARQTSLGGRPWYA